MRLRRASPLLLLLAPSLVSAASEHRLYKRDAFAADANPALQRRELQEISRDPAPEQAANPRPGTVQKPYKGTEDAPVDGEDGKPKVGPFVDYAAEKTRTKKTGAEATKVDKEARPTSLDRFKEGTEEWKLEDIPEKNDGVMNDENRVAPKKGTDGTAGGISEKEKERKAKGFAAENKPQQPKEAPELPHSEEERWQEEQKRKMAKEAADGKLTEKEKADMGEGGFGLEKPTDLPERPHSTPYTEPQHSKEDDPTLQSDRGSWLTDTMPYTEGKINTKQPVTKPDPVTGAPVLVVSDDESWHEWFHSFVLSFTMIIFSEIGDKTFLVAALMAMRHPRLLVFSAALGALIVMTVLSAVLGHAVPTLLPKRLTTFAAAVLFLVFGARMMREGLAMDKNLGVGEEMKEVEAELEEKEHSMARDRSRRRASSAVTPYTLESGRGRKPSNIPGSEPSPPSSRSPSPRSAKDRLTGLMNLISLVLSPAWVQTFVMTFLGEWGDRSQIATIAMAAGQDYWLVTLGAIAGHACCTGMAVIGGAALAGKVSLRVVTIGGAGAFLVFGVIYLFECLAES